LLVFAAGCAHIARMQPGVSHHMSQRNRETRGLFGLAIGIPALLARAMILLYRYTLSSIAGRTCRHLPTCSEYADIAIARFGLWRGGWIAVARFWRCRPLGTHGFDPVPEMLPENARWYRPWRYGRWASIQPD
jgi:putative membrane protein insertion efficiency factor